MPLVLSPGATTAVVLRNSIAGGARAGLFTALGANAGSFCYGLLTAFGFAAAVQRWPSVWIVLRWAGVAYLTWLGLQSLRRGWDPPRAAVVASGPADRGFLEDLLSGFLTNVLNPALMAFYLVVLPQFIPRDEPFARGALVLTAIHISLAFTWHVAWAFAGARLAMALSRRRPRQALELLTGLALLLLAGAVAF